MKRFIAVLVCIFMLVSLLPAFAFAEEGGNDPIEATPTPTVETTPEQTKDTTTTPTSTPTQPVEEQQLTSTGAPENTGTAYTVSVSASPAEGGTASAGLASGATGKEVTLTAAPTEGYQFKEWQVVSGGVTVTDDKFTIGTANVEVKAIFEAISTTEYTVTVTNDGNGTGNANPTSGTEGTEVTLSATPNEGYVFKEWQVVSGGVTIADNKFKIGTSDVKVKAIFEKGYTVTVTNDGNGTASADISVGASGTEVTLTASPKEGYAFAGWQVISGGVTVENNKFKIGTENVEIKATFLPPDIKTVTNLNISYGKITYGETLEINVSPATRMMTRAATFGTLKLRVNGCEVASTGIDTMPFTWRVPVTKAYGFSAGTNKVEVVHVGTNGTETLSDSECVTVLSPCTPKPPCKPSHYCCGKNHFSGKCVTVRAGEDVTFKVELGCNETCQWYVNKGDGCGFVKIEGATSPRLTLKNVKYKQDGYMYRCIVQNCCDVVSKPIFTLNVASGQLYTPKTGDNGVITVAAGCAAVAALILVGGRRSSRAKQKN